jgi:superfamily I DNA/RNA helicase
MKALLSSLILVLTFTTSLAQTSESLKERIQEHYKAIHSLDLDVIKSHHLEEFSMFFGDNTTLFESGFEETAEKMGCELVYPVANVTMKHFNAQIYDNVGIAMFYLEGTFDKVPVIKRVTAVWVWTSGEWKEVHHHESALKTE